MNLLFLKALVHFDRAGGAGNGRQYICNMHIEVVAEGSACGRQRVRTDMASGG